MNVDREQNLYCSVKIRISDVGPMKLTTEMRFLLLLLTRVMVPKWYHLSPGLPLGNLYIISLCWL